LLHLLLAVALVAGAPQYRLDNPAQVLAMKDGALLVAERGTHNRLLRVNPATGATSIYATGIPSPWGVAYARDGSILVSGTGGLYRLRPRTRITSVGVSPFVPLPDGRIAYANETSAGVIAGGKARVWPMSVSAPHGLTLLPDGALALGDTGNNRILRIDPASGTSTVLTDRVTTALGLIAEPSGSVLTVEYSSGRLLRVTPDGTVSVVASGLRKPYALARTRTGTVYVVESVADYGQAGRIRRITPDGRRSVVPLRPPPAVRRTAAATPKPIVGQPYDLLPLKNGRFLVTDMYANAVYELDPVRKTGRLAARIAQARELHPLPDGRVLVSSGLQVLALNLRTHRTSVYATARNYLLGIALAPDGWLYGSENVIGSEQTTLVRIRGGTRQVLGEFHGVHGILVTADGLILSESYGGRVLHFDPETKTTKVLASGLKNPSFTLPAASGGWFVSEFFGARISHLWPDGHVTTVAPVFKPGPIEFDSLHRIVGITQNGTTLFRIVRGRARALYP
jgi:sugar lactone lactonase YvrE